MAGKVRPWGWVSGCVDPSVVVVEHAAAIEYAEQQYECAVLRLCSIRTEETDIHEKADREP